MKAEWYFDEFTQVGTDYTDLEKVGIYDAKMQKFRNYEREAKLILSTLKIKPDDIILEIGTGTGHFALEASKKCKKVYAVDVSKTMLEYAKLKSEKENIKNIEWINSGFLNFEFPDIKFDHIVTNAALHHLPDFWKVLALKNIYNSLKNDGKFFLGDVIFSFNTDEISSKINTWINNSKKIDDDFYSEAIIHTKEEYSTFSWIIEAILEKIGFKYQKLSNDNTNNIIVYLCTKN
jgi:ubiquinone/menaquinone biosynthesis C-methylase UbiE